MVFSRFCVLCAAVAGMAAAQTAPVDGGMSGFDLNALDRKTDPCVNFYQFACGNWMASNPIPADKSRWGRFDVLGERTRDVLRGILEQAAKPSSQRSAVEQKIGDFYAACMDEAAIEKLGTKPIQDDLERIRKMAAKDQLDTVLAELHLQAVPAFFGFGPTPDFKNSTATIAEVDQGGLSLPDRDYYLEPRFAEIKKKYQAHVQRMFELLGDAPQAAARKAETVVDIETRLAKASLDRVSRRNANNIYHKMPVKQLEQLAPVFDWRAYFQTTGAPGFDSLNVAVPNFVKGLDAVLRDAELDALKTYLSWKVVHNAAALLPQAFVDEDFEFFGKTLTGAKELRPRWNRCVIQTDAALGEALGRKYVEAAFSGNSKQRMLELVGAIERSFERNLDTISWMTPATKKKALEKLHAVTNKIGYPEKWRDYGKVKITRGDALGNVERADEFEVRRQLATIGTPVDPKEWRMTPPTVNAYYSPLENNINFPAGILQPPFFDNRLDDAVNFGAIGAVIGHELTHGFDDSGRRFDAKGNLHDWWTSEDATEFEKRAECVINQYGNYTAVADVKLNGKLTLGENVADNGGVRLAYMALMDVLTRKPQGKIDGFTPQQRFFLGYAQIWCQNVTEEESRRRAQTDPHSPGEHRVNGVLSNSPEFRSAFGCSPGQPMAPANACRVW
jgi:endothelin-converting enzyme/putative endopeptidase